MMRFYLINNDLINSGKLFLFRDHLRHDDVTKRLWDRSEIEKKSGLLALHTNFKIVHEFETNTHENILSLWRKF